MTAPAREVVIRGVDALRRSALWWTFGIVVFVLINLAFWPSLRDSDTLQSLEESTGELLEAFGGAGLATAPGYLDGQVFALMLPLLLSGMALAMVTALTAGDEDAGRLELLHALPLSRRTLWLGRFAAVLATLVAVTAVVAASMLVSLPAFQLTDAGYGRVIAATAACGLLGLFHGAVGYAAAGAGFSRARAVSSGVVVLVVGYLMSAVLPLADALEPARNVSPWYWAIRTQPVSEGVPWLGCLALLAVTAALVAFGTARVERRDIRAA